MNEFFNDNIKAVIFDLGNVLVNIDWQETFKCLTDKAFVENFDWDRFQEVLFTYEKGLMSSAQFRDELRDLMNAPQRTDKEIDDCWNAMIFDFPEIRKDIVRKLRETYPVYVLSNISEIHRKYVVSQPYWDESLFDKVFWSCKLGSRKPEKEIYLKVLDEIKREPQEVLFFDDREDNVLAAKKIGMNAVLVDKPLEEILKNVVVLD